MLLVAAGHAVFKILRREDGEDAAHGRPVPVILALKPRVEIAGAPVFHGVHVDFAVRDLGQHVGVPERGVALYAVLLEQILRDILQLGVVGVHLLVPVSGVSGQKDADQRQHRHDAQNPEPAGEAIQHPEEGKDEQERRGHVVADGVGQRRCVIVKERQHVDEHAKRQRNGHEERSEAFARVERHAQQQDHGGHAGDGQQHGEHGDDALQRKQQNVVAIAEERHQADDLIGEGFHGERAERRFAKELKVIGIGQHVRIDGIADERGEGQQRAARRKAKRGQREDAGQAFAAAHIQKQKNETRGQQRRDADHGHAHAVQAAVDAQQDQQQRLAQPLPVHAQHKADLDKGEHHADGVESAVHQREGIVRCDGQNQRAGAQQRSGQRDAEPARKIDERQRHAAQQHGDGDGAGDVPVGKQAEHQLIHRHRADDAQLGGVIPAVREEDAALLVEQLGKHEFRRDVRVQIVPAVDRIIADGHAQAEKKHEDGQKRFEHAGSAALHGKIPPCWKMVWATWTHRPYMSLATATRYL